MYKVEFVLASCVHRSWNLAQKFVEGIQFTTEETNKDPYGYKINNYLMKKSSSP